MNLKELKAGQGKVDVEVTVKSKEEPRSFNKYGKDLRVANAMVSDSSGEIKLSLWNDDIEKIKVGDVLKISNGYVSEFNGEKQLSAGKYGKIEVVTGSSSASPGAGNPGESAPASSSEKPAKKKAVKKEESFEEKEF